MSAIQSIRNSSICRCITTINQKFDEAIKAVIRAVLNALVSVARFFGLITDSCYNRMRDRIRELRPNRHSSNNLPQNPILGVGRIGSRPQIPSLRDQDLNTKLNAYRDLPLNSPGSFMRYAIELYRASLTPAELDDFNEGVQTSAPGAIDDVMKASFRAIIISPRNVEPQERPNYMNEVMQPSQASRGYETLDPWNKLTEARDLFRSLSPNDQIRINEQIHIIDNPIIPSQGISQIQVRINPGQEPAQYAPLSENGKKIYRYISDLTTVFQRSNQRFLDCVRKVFEAEQREETPAVKAEREARIAARQPAIQPQPQPNRPQMLSGAEIARRLEAQRRRAQQAQSNVSASPNNSDSELQAAIRASLHETQANQAQTTDSETQAQARSAAQTTLHGMLAERLREARVARAAAFGFEL